MHNITSQLIKVNFNLKTYVLIMKKYTENIQETIIVILNFLKFRKIDIIIKLCLIHFETNLKHP